MTQITKLHYDQVMTVMDNQIKKSQYCEADKKFYQDLKENLQNNFTIIPTGKATVFFDKGIPL